MGVSIYVVNSTGQDSIDDTFPGAGPGIVAVFMLEQLTRYIAQPVRTIIPSYVNVEGLSLGNIDDMGNMYEISIIEAIHYLITVHHELCALGLGGVLTSLQVRPHHAVHYSAYQCTDILNALTRLQPYAIKPEDRDLSQRLMVLFTAAAAGGHISIC
jgi:hypothetical protein